MKKYKTLNERLYESNDESEERIDEDSIYTYLPNGQIDCGFTMEDIFEYMDTGIDKKNIISKNDNIIIEVFENLIRIIRREGI